MTQATPLLRAMFAIVWKDLAAEWRSRELVSSMLVFALLDIFNRLGGCNPTLCLDVVYGSLHTLSVVL